MRVLFCRGGGGLKGCSFHPCPSKRPEIWRVVGGAGKHGGLDGNESWSFDLESLGRHSPDRNANLLSQSCQYQDTRPVRGETTTPLFSPSNGPPSMGALQRGQTTIANLFQPTSHRDSASPSRSGNDGRTCGGELCCVSEERAPSRVRGGQKTQKLVLHVENRAKRMQRGEESHLTRLGHHRGCEIAIHHHTRTCPAAKADLLVARSHRDLSGFPCRHTSPSPIRES